MDSVLVIKKCRISENFVEFGTVKFDDKNSNLETLELSRANSRIWTSETVDR